jgi:hypothetical protein
MKRYTLRRVKGQDGVAYQKVESPAVVLLLLFFEKGVSTGVMQTARINKIPVCDHEPVPCISLNG